MVAPDLGRVHVELHDLLRGLEGGDRAARADGEHDVGGVEVLAQRVLGPQRGAQRHVAVIADGALALGRLHHAGLEILGHRGERLVGAGGVHAVTNSPKRWAM